MIAQTDRPAVATPSSVVKVALIGLDTSHSVEFARRMQAPDCPGDQKVAGFRAVTCFRFETPFQNREGLDSRSRTLRAWGVNVTENLEEALSGVDALMLEVNDPAAHLPMVKACVGSGLPMFLDKPLADTHGNGLEILKLVQSAAIPFCSASPLRFAAEVVAAAEAVPQGEQVHVYGPLGRAPAGSSVVWYGVHAFEMLQKLLGPGAVRVKVLGDDRGLVARVDYGDGRRGVVELTRDAPHYGGSVRGHGKARAFTVNMADVYRDELIQIGRFFTTGVAPATGDDARQVLAMLEATEMAAARGEEVAIPKGAG